MYRVEDLCRDHGQQLSLELVAGREGMRRKIYFPEPHRPGLVLAGYRKEYPQKRILVFGVVETSYLFDIEESSRLEQLNWLVDTKVPAIIVAGRRRPPKELVQMCDQESVPLLRSRLKTEILINQLSFLLNDALAPIMSCHGTLVEVFGVGVLIKGESSVGKSEAALGLIERGHRLIADDIVKIRKKEGGYLDGFGNKMARHHMEIRGIGIINVAHLFGAVRVRDHKSVDVVVFLELWDNEKFYDRAGLDDKRCDILGVSVPYHVLPVKPGRDVVLLLETLALNHRLKEMGLHSAREFNDRLIRTITSKNSQGYVEETETNDKGVLI